jgi:hydroxyethylthiazole kinase-like uncharacterized protein yjeF
VSGAPVFTTAEIRALEERAAKGLAGPTLMQRAGKAAAEAAKALAKDTGGTILVVAGPGNNGGDAWVAAAHLREDFHRVAVLDVAGATPKAAEAREAKAAFAGMGGSVLREWPQDLRPALVVDGLFGIGLARELDEPTRALVRRINAAGAPVLAIDIPSGLGSDSGRIGGEAVRATRTITFIARKIGLHTAEGVDCCGEILVDDLGLDARLLAGAKGELLTPEAVGGWLRPRARQSHKGQFGTLGIIGGNRGMVGAALLAARAGLLAGAGKVYVGLLASDAPTVDFAYPELMLRPVDDVMAADALVVGPGAGQSPSATSASMFERAILPASFALAKPLVLDADALNAVAFSDVLEKELAGGRKAATILTPHPAEAARLLKTTSADVQADRLAAALAIARRFNAFAVLKGAGSICASPSGQWSVNATGNPGLASGGTGDVLAGMIGALLCQGLDPWQALRYAVCLHGAAADACAARAIGPVGLTASEVALESRRVLNEWITKMGSDSI